jgi:cytochrome c oxidase subunit 2
MPIAVHVVSDAEFATWLEDAKKKFAATAAPTTVAAAHFKAE